MPVLSEIPVLPNFVYKQEVNSQHTNGLSTTLTLSSMESLEIQLMSQLAFQCPIPNPIKVAASVNNIPYHPNFLDTFDPLPHNGADVI